LDDSQKHPANTQIKNKGYMQVYKTRQCYKQEQECNMENGEYETIVNYSTSLQGSILREYLKNKKEPLEVKSQKEVQCKRYQQ
jgi:hypothetical protein